MGEIHSSAVTDCGSFSIVNTGQAFYYPPKSMIKGLEKVIIFTENTHKKGIPNGSVFVYAEDTPYIPGILKSDVGCGISSCVIPEIKEMDEKTISDILDAVNEVGIHIGQGNHFLDFTTGHPEARDGYDMIFLHSDFNNDNILPTTYEEAKDLENAAIHQRRSYLEKLTKVLGLPFKYYRDWTHNSVNVEDDKIVYRKGAINIALNEGVGALALNPVDGIYLYAARWKDYHHSMQHGSGRIGSLSELYDKLTKIKTRKVVAYTINQEDPELKSIKEEVYNPFSLFFDKFWHKHKMIGYCIPKLVVTTKK